MTDTPRSPLTRREVWLYRLTLLSMLVFVALGVYVLYFPSEALVALFAIMTLVTLGLGVVAGIVSVYSD